MAFRRALTLLLALAVLSAPAFAAGVREESQSYDPTTQARYVCGVNGQDAGSGCFPLDGSETGASFRVVDATGLPVPGFYSFLLSDGTFAGEGRFCGEATVEIPEGAAWLDVFPSPAALAFASVCPGTPTMGAIVATFTLE